MPAKSIIKTLYTVQRGSPSGVIIWTKVENVGYETTAFVSPGGIYALFTMQ